MKFDIENWGAFVPALWRTYSNQLNFKQHVPRIKYRLGNFVPTTKAGGVTEQLHQSPDCQFGTHLGNVFASVQEFHFQFVFEVELMFPHRFASPLDVLSCKLQPIVKLLVMNKQKLRFRWQSYAGTFTIECEEDIYVIYRLGGPYREKLWPRSWKCSQFFMIRTDPKLVNNLFIFFLL